MNRWMIYGFATLLFLGGLAAFMDKSQINALRGVIGLEPLHESEVADLSVRETEAWLADVGARPVPGIVDEAPPLGEAAKAAAECAAETAPRRPHGAAIEAVERYLLTLAASGIMAEPALLEPSLRDRQRVTAIGPMAVLDAARQGALTPDEAAWLARFHAAYSDPEHPLYRGLGLYDGTFDAMEFETMARNLAVDWDKVAACTEAAALPGLVEWQRVVID